MSSCACCRALAVLLLPTKIPLMGLGRDDRAGLSCIAACRNAGYSLERWRPGLRLLTSAAVAQSSPGLCVQADTRLVSGSHLYRRIKRAAECWSAYRQTPPLLVQLPSGRSPVSTVTQLRSRTQPDGGAKRRHTWPLQTIPKWLPSSSLILMPPIDGSYLVASVLIRG